MAFFVASLCWFPAHAQDTVAVPTLTARVTDLTGTLTAQQTQSLETQLASLEQRKGAQVVVLMLPSTQPEPIEDYATRAFDQWKIGRKKVDDGVLVVVAKNDHRAMIETGYGLEGAIPDAAAARIIREYMAPKFRANDYYGGLNDALGAIEKLVDGEPLPPPLEGKPQRQGNGFGGGWYNGLIVAWIALFWARGLFARVPRFPRAGLVGVAAGGFAWLFS
ncbi:MAG: TPM domain-containing protein, partial [Rhodanobacteraceae bacterium]